MSELRDYLAAQASGDLLPWQAQRAAAEEFSLTFGQVEEAALELGLMPARYQRNRRMISVSQQLMLFRSKVAVIGCGGLGGYVIEELARLGVGHLVVVDPDVFEEHNLNRQLLSSPKVLGKPKVEVARGRVSEINPAVTVKAIKETLSETNASRHLSGTSAAVDCLDNIPDRLVLGEVCRTQGIPLVHGTIAGWYGQVSTQFPGEDTLGRIYRLCTVDRGIERTLGNPSFTPAVVASLQVAEICKIITEQGNTLRNGMLSINLLEMEIVQISL